MRHFKIVHGDSNDISRQRDFLNMLRKLVEKKVAKKFSLRAGFEPAREDPIGFQVQRLNHSAITAHS